MDGTNLRATMHPPPAEATQEGITPVVTPGMEQTAVAEIMQDEWKMKEWKGRIRARILPKIWPTCKLPDYNSRSGERLKQYVSKQLNVGPEFDNLWAHAISTQMNAVLRIKRAYSVQKMKDKFFGKWWASNVVAKHKAVVPC